MVQCKDIGIYTVVYQCSIYHHADLRIGAGVCTHSILEECSTERHTLKISRKMAHKVQEHNAL